jgi:hypothetical protein
VTLGTDAAVTPAAAPPQFYLVFALASMYIAMLMTGWGSQAGEAKVRRARPAGGRGGLPTLGEARPGA